MPHLHPCTVRGIPAQVQVHSHTVVKGSRSPTAPSPDDYYGYYELDYTLFDRKGRKADWLEAILDRFDLRAEFEADLHEQLVQE